VATRSISTYQPAVTCDVCGRNLLRGEQPEVFLAGGERRMVCELCRPRATHEGWLREADGHPVIVEATRGRRGRSFMGRLRPRRAPREDMLAAEEPIAYEEPPTAGYEPEFAIAEPSGAVEDEWLVAPEPAQVVAADRPADPPRSPLASRDARPAAVAAAVRTPRSVHAVPTNADFKAARALEVFNASEYPRRMAGVARSLGLPEVTARPITPDSTVMTIVVAWELCWYRYEVDLGDERAGARLVGQGAELDELDALDRAANATADDRGELRMLAL
jgi:hypothetical protein